MIGPHRSLTRHEVQLAHRLALGMALARRHIHTYANPQHDRAGLVLEEARRLERTVYDRLSDDELEHDLTCYALPDEYRSSRSHAPFCDTTAPGGGRCTCRVPGEPVE